MRNILKSKKFVYNLIDKESTEQIILANSLIKCKSNTNEKATVDKINNNDFKKEKLLIMKANFVSKQEQFIKEFDEEIKKKVRLLCFIMISNPNFFLLAISKIRLIFLLWTYTWKVFLKLLIYTFKKTNRKLQICTAADHHYIFNSALLKLTKRLSRIIYYDLI
jgi:hypothetical protein